jgi:PE family
MSFLSATPDLVQGAAQDLAGIRSSLAQATSTAAGPTTGIAAAAQDEVSLAIASMFGNHAQEFQALSAQAQAFHAEFVSAMNGSAAAYVGAEAAGQTLMSAAAAPAQALFGGGAAMVTGQGAATMAQGIGSFWAAAAAPYQQLVINTNNNLAAINSTYMANPHPLLTQFMSNQMGFANTFGSGIVTDLQGFPGNVPANIQLAVQGAATFNPGLQLQNFMNGQMGTVQTVIPSLQLAHQDINAGLPTAQAAVQTAFQELLAGNPIGAYGTLSTGLQNAFLPGFTTDSLIGPTAPVVPLGPLGALAPIFTLPGQMAQSFTNLLPPGSILAQMSQNGTNVVSALTNLTTTTGVLENRVNFGVGLQLLFDGIGGPANALSALNSTGVAFTGAMQAGNPSAAALALLDAPANMTNGYLNGQTFITLPQTVVENAFGVTLQIPLGGVLTPLSLPLDAGLEGVGMPPTGPFTPLLPPSTELGGLIPGLQSINAQLAPLITPPM